MNNSNLKTRILLLLGLVIFNLSCLLAAPNGTQQEKNIMGTVTDDKGEPLPGVSVVIKGTTKGTMTDLDGNYTISVPNTKTILQFSFLGFIPQSVEVGTNSKIDVKLVEDIQNLDEVVVVGYGVQKKSHLTGSISKLNGEGLANMPVTRVDQALQGKIAGVNIQNTTSETGVAPQIRVRGMGSLSVGGEPLVVVDGYPVADGLSFVEAADIESIEVLKDAASSAIYGSRGANGVIMITTKTGNIAKPKYTFNMYHGFKNAYKLHPNINYSDYIGLLFEEAALRQQDPSVSESGWNKITDQERAEYIINTQRNAYTRDPNDPNKIIWLNQEENTDWQKEAIRDNAYMSNYQLSVSGGTKEVRYYLSGNYNTDEGMMYHNKYDKLSVRAKIDAQLNKKVKVGVNISPTYSKRERPSNNYTDFYRFRSWLPAKHNEGTALLTGQPVGSWAHSRHFSGLAYEGTMPDGSYWESSGSLDPWSSQNNNPKSIMEGDTRKTHQYRVMTNAYLTYQIMKGLEFKTSDGVYINYTKDNAYLSAGAKKDGEPSQGTFKSSFTTDILSENTLNYNTTINKDHSISTLIGFTYQRTNKEFSQILGSNYPTDDIETLNYASIIDAQNTYTYKVAEALVSYLGRINYAYKDKYLVSASLRTDGSSRFAPGNRWSWFPSISVGWRAEEEAFMKPINWLSTLKLKASYGLTGNNNLPTNTNGSNRVSSYAYSNTFFPASYSFGNAGTITPGLAVSSYTLGNKDLTWERTNEYNAGLDFGIFKNRILLGLEYYYSITDRLLLKQGAMSFTGYNEFWNNAGKVRNRGLEIELTTVNIVNKDLEWKTSINFSSNRNKLLSLGGPAHQYNYGERNEVYAAIVGQQAIQYYGYKTDGVWLSDDQIAEAKKNTDYKVTTAAGGLKIVDTNNDGIVDANDRVVIGSPFPDFTWGITNTVSYKGFDFSVLIQGVQGLDIINGDQYYNDFLKMNKKFLTNRWVSPMFPGDGKTPYYTNGMQRILTDYVVEDGSYISFRDIQLGYRLPANFVKKSLKLQSVRVYSGIQNLLYIMASGYKGINPESRYNSASPYDSPLVDGYQRGGYPLQRTFTIGLDLTF
ncbi:TonB-dependent receptor [Dysgonomonas sp. BGC7]|uniref:SusC/RagA family TonB-linked outer membrane protein n=1 Tax=Dysgonomonas sp. BGC7 TaxID=1658008 RepID=UPI000683520B|nr:TonB-dependent receptor [Dysgonomonas sp. BGC7]